MKLLSPLLALFFAASFTLVATSARAQSTGTSLTCQTLTKGEYDMSLKIEVKNFAIVNSSFPESAGLELYGMMNDVKVTAKFKDFHEDGTMKTEIGRRDFVQDDRNYSPRKYKNTLRFNFDELTNVDTFGDFSPQDSCSINLMVPKDAEKRVSFEAYVVTSCDQSGGSQTLACTLTPNKKR